MSETADARHEPSLDVAGVCVYGVLTGVSVTATAFSAVGAPQSMLGVGLGMTLFGLSFYKLGKHAGWDDE